MLEVFLTWQEQLATTRGVRNSGLVGTNNAFLDRLYTVERRALQWFQNSLLPNVSKV